MSDPFVIMFQIISTKRSTIWKLPTKLLSTLNTDPNADPRGIVKRSEKNGLYAAMDIGSIWFERALESK